MTGEDYAYRIRPPSIAENVAESHGGRGTGHFGTGVYFLGGPEHWELAKQPVYRLAIPADANLFRPGTHDQAHALHRGLQWINRAVHAPEGYQGYTGGLMDDEAMMNTADSHLIRGGLYNAREHMPDAIRFARDQAAQLEAMRDMRSTNPDYYYSVAGQSPSGSTRLMQALGYHGVDVRALPSLDNTEYGSVIYPPHAEQVIQSATPYSSIASSARMETHDREEGPSLEGPEAEEVRLRRPREGQLAQASQGDAEAQVAPEEPIFPDLDDAVRANQESLAGFGQTNHALLRPDVLEGALGRAANHWYYEGSLPKAAAALAHGVGQAQAFEDGNKRTAYWLTNGFLHANGLGHISPADDPELADHLVGYGEGTHGMEDTAALFEARLGQSPGSVTSASQDFYNPVPAHDNWTRDQMAALQPAERAIYGGGWDAIRRDFEENHPKVMAALREDIKERGLRTPLIVDPEKGLVHNGHHRYLAGMDVGVDRWPVHFGNNGQPEGMVESYIWDPDLRDHVPDPDDEPHQASAPQNALTPWEPGRWGKGITLPDGTRHMWSTNAPADAGEPSHYNAYNHLVGPPSDPENYPAVTGILIAPSGEYTTDEVPTDAHLGYAAQDPRLKMVQRDRWLRQNLSSMASAPQVMYHVAPQEARESIAREGLTGRHGDWEDVIWMWDHLPTAQAYAQPGTDDVYRVDVSGLGPEPGGNPPSKHGGLAYAVNTNTIEPERLSLVSPARTSAGEPPSRSWRQGNVLDKPHPGLDPKVWDYAESDRPVLKPVLANWIIATIYDVLEQAGYDGMGKWLRLVLTGSLTTYQYSDQSDCDVSLFVETAKFPEWSRAEMIGVMVSGLDGIKLHGTTHPMQGFVVSPKFMPTDLYKPGLRSGYDIKAGLGARPQDAWIVPPDRTRIHDPEHEMNGFYTYALEVADKMDRLLRYEPDKAVQYYNQIHRRRMRDQGAAKGDFSESNIVYKMLDNRGLLARLKDAGAKVAQIKQADDVPDHLPEEWEPEQDPNTVPWHAITEALKRMPQDQAEQEAEKLARNIIERQKQMTGNDLTHEGRDYTDVMVHMLRTSLLGRCHRCGSTHKVVPGTGKLLGMPADYCAYCRGDEERPPKPRELTALTESEFGHPVVFDTTSPHIVSVEDQRRHSDYDPCAQCGRPRSAHRYAEWELARHHQIDRDLGHDPDLRADYSQWQPTGLNAGWRDEPPVTYHPWVEGEHDPDPYPERHQFDRPSLEAAVQQGGGTFQTEHDTNWALTHDNGIYHFRRADEHPYTAPRFNPYTDPGFKVPAADVHTALGLMPEDGPRMGAMPAYHPEPGVTQEGDIEKYLAGLQASSRARPGFVTVHPPEYYQAPHRVFTSPDGQQGYALLNHGDGRTEIAGVFNNDPEHRGAAQEAVRQGFRNGGNYLECFERHPESLERFSLPHYYHSLLGALPTGYHPWDEQYRPEGWDEGSHRTPGLVELTVPNEANQVPEAWLNREHDPAELERRLAEVRGQRQATYADGLTGEDHRALWDEFEQRTNRERVEHEGS